MKNNLDTGKIAYLLSLFDVTPITEKDFHFQFQKALSMIERLINLLEQMQKK